MARIPIDPRVFAKNFAMPMPPAVVHPTVDSGPVRRGEAPTGEFPVTEYGPSRYESPTISTRGRDADSIPPLLSTLYRKEDGNHTVTVTEGRVIEIIPKKANQSDDSVIEHPIANIWAQPGKILNEHGPMVTGKCVGVYYEVNKYGYVKSQPEIRVVQSGDGDRSTHYQPPIGDDPGADGDVFVKLAEVVGSGDNQRIETYHSGTNVIHYHDTPVFALANESSGVDLFKKYDLVEGLYRYLGIRGEHPIDVAVLGADIVVKYVGGGGNLNLKIKTFELTESSRTIPITLVGETGVVETGGGRTPDGDHTHPIVNLPITISALTLTGITIANPATPDAIDGAHTHSLSVDVAFDSDTLTGTTVPTDSETSDGIHGHTLSASVTIPQQTLVGGTTTDGAHGHSGASISESAIESVAVVGQTSSGGSFDPHSHYLSTLGGSAALSAPTDGLSVTIPSSGGHSHNVSVTFPSTTVSNIPISIGDPNTSGAHTHAVEVALPALSGSFTINGNSDDGGHSHVVSVTASNIQASITNASPPDGGAHKHAVTLQTEIQVPVQSFEVATNFTMLCFRNGLYVGMYPDGNGAPFLQDCPEHTIYSWAGPPASPE